jgi:3-deoxy-D-manno-octulosonic-acid transferase
MLYLVYNSLLILAALLALPLLPLLALFPRGRQGLSQRLGILPRMLRQQALIHEGSVWVHAASLGEVNAIAPVLRELLPQVPRQALVLTCTTVAGREQARRLFPQATACLLLPLDLPWLLRPWIRRFKPRLVLVAETELWPNFLRELKWQGAQILVANGRLTQRSFQRYKILGKAFHEVLDCVEVFAMQAEADADRIVALGARRARVLVVGNTKFDLAADLNAAREQAELLRRDLGWRRDQPVIVAGSIRPGEEALLAAAFVELRKRRPDACLVLAPRHLDRVGESEAALKAVGLKPVKRSAWTLARGATVILLDTLGELRAFYALAEQGGLAWVGGSFRDFGGQNPLEPAGLGVPVFFGPFMRHFPEVAAALTDCGAARQVDAGALASASLAWLDDPKARSAAAEAALACVRSRSGASKRSAELAWKLLLVARLKRQGRSRGQDGFDMVRDLEPVGPAREADETRVA